MALDRIDCFGHRFLRRQITEAPAGHGVCFAEAVNGNCEFVCLLRERRDAHVLGVIVNEFLVNFVRQNVNVFLSGDIDDGLQLFTRIDGASWVTRAIHDQHLGARGHCIFKIFSAHFPRVAFAGGHDHRFGAG